MKSPKEKLSNRVINLNEIAGFITLHLDTPYLEMINEHFQHFIAAMPDFEDGKLMESMFTIRQLLGRLERYHDSRSLRYLLSEWEAIQHEFMSYIDQDKLTEADTLYQQNSLHQ